jgi:hypothetical protein
MESERFDTLSRVLGDVSRRGLLPTVLGPITAGALTALGVAQREDAEAGGACKQACGTCQRCKKGKCKKKHGKKRCKKGRCIPAEAGTPCSEGDGGTCCAAGSGRTRDGCCGVAEACCPDASGGACCPSLADCCVENGNCENVAICVLGCCQLI